LAKLRRQQVTAREGDGSILSADVTERGNGSLATRVTERGNEPFAEERGNGERSAHVTERGNGSLASRITERGNVLLADVKERGNGEHSAHVTERGNGGQSALSSSVLSNRGGGNPRVQFQIPKEGAATPETAGALSQNSYSVDDRMRNSFQYHTPASSHREQHGISFGSTEVDRPSREDQPIREEHWEALTNNSSRRPFSPDLERILKRVHNLELLAAQGESRTQQGSIPARNNSLKETEEKMAQDVPEGGGDRDVYSADLERAVQRIETIEADFELLHQKYRSLGGARAGNLERREDEGWNNGQISRELVVQIEQEILAELLKSELWYS
jgi:hypothetical protein